MISFYRLNLIQKMYYQLVIEFIKNILHQQI